MSDWRIEIMAPSSEGAYSDLVASASGASLCHTLIWRDILLDLKMGEPVYWLAYHGTRLRGALPAFVLRSGREAVLNSLPFMQSTGGAVCANDLDERKRPALANRLIGAALEWCRSNDVDIACVVGSAFTGPDITEGLPRPPDFVMERTIRVLNLTQPLDFRPSVTGAVRKAARRSPVMREAGSPGEAALVYDIYAGNMRRIGTEPIDRRFYESLFERAHKKGHARFIWAEAEGEPVASVVMIRHGDTADYYSAGSTVLGRSMQAGNWLCDRQIRIAKAAGLRWWNWMASPNKQVYDFKKRWGGEDRRYAVRVWSLGDREAWLRRSPRELSDRFPGYFVMPYDRLMSKENVS